MSLHTFRSKFKYVNSELLIDFLRTKFPVFYSEVNNSFSICYVNRDQPIITGLILDDYVLYTTQVTKIEDFSLCKLRRPVLELDVHLGLALVNKAKDLHSKTILIPSVSLENNDIYLNNAFNILDRNCV